jgi:two-component system capsular synthesis sensor histidine kinase RcsC
MTEPVPCASPLSGRLLLLVEDDPAQLEDYRRMLERLGCAVFAAATAEAGIAFARSVSIDAILTDNVLTGMTGLRSIAEYAKSTDAPVVIMTSHVNADLEKDARLLGAKGVFSKPLVREAILAGLVEKIEAVRPRATTRPGREGGE